jgi:hypothetical protein
LLPFSSHDGTFTALPHREIGAAALADLGWLQARWGFGKIVGGCFVTYRYQMKSGRELSSSLICSVQNGSADGILWH